MINTKLCKACSFLSIVYWNVHVSSSGKSSFWACWFFQPSSLPDFLQKPICIAPASSALPAQHLAVWLYRTLQCSGLQWAPVTELNDFFFQFAFLSPPLPLQHSYHGAASPTVFPPLTLLPSVVTQSSHMPGRNQSCLHHMWFCGIYMCKIIFKIINIFYPAFFRRYNSLTYSSYMIRFCYFIPLTCKYCFWSF